ncbi:hypothetical protein PR202_ga04546 [Eleusine coracana subsp. coracana]|uniref:Methyltransferase type 11 domain-containing protein n=1 Tax=Eleusine coracana subsp. coracana TaxID=191504 RepID=A0AAV5BRF1_ELECO|nr:hypothetical protein PR202_ga04546 [Eleusine coracana subsp. coracana]
MSGGGCKSKDFGAAAYWDARYSSGSSAGGGGGGGGFFDWYQTYPALRPLLRARVPASSRVLMLGCGNSRTSPFSCSLLAPMLSEDMANDGYEDIVNIDISSVVIEQMKEKHTEIPQLKYMQMDVRDMSVFDDESFDCVLDKGTLDAMMNLKNIRKLEELTSDLFFLFTATPECQSKMSECDPQPIMEEVTLTEDGQLPPDYVLKDPESHFIYICHKSNPADRVNFKDTDPEEMI